MTEEKKTTGKKTTASLVVSWLVAVAALAFAILKGGSASVEVPCMDGGKCLLFYDQSEGILDLKDDCKFKELGDKCKGTITVTYVYSEAGPDKPEEEEAEKVPVEKPLEVPPAESEDAEVSDADGEGSIVPDPEEKDAAKPVENGGDEL